MGTNIQGYVEINTIQNSDEDIWFDIVNIDIIAERNYEIFGQLFGVRASKDIKSLAPSRGIPPRTSDKEVISDKNYTSVVDQSWVDWSELSEYLITNNFKNKHYFGWRFIFSSMKKLAKEYGDKNVRLVVAFDNNG